ncbi:MAG: diadenylate cyclase CdaA [Bacteroidales bacterium]
MLIRLTLFDFIDILLVAIILFQLYRLIRGTAAFSIFIAVFFIYVFWLIVKALNMELVSTILGQVIGVGVIALFIVFQQEVRRFLLMIGNKYISSSGLSFDRFFSSSSTRKGGHGEAEQIVRAAEYMAARKTGALIVIGRKSRLDVYTEGGEMINATISAELLETIFFKNSPLHDGAVLIEDGKILAARCPLPITDQIAVPSRLGMRHRAAIGLSEQTDSLVLVVSEETGNISVSESGHLREGLSTNDLREILFKEKI